MIKARLKSAFLNPKIREKCLKDFSLTFEKMGLPSERALALAERTIREISVDNTMEETERVIQGVFNGTKIGDQSFLSSLQSDLRAREEIIVSQISPFLGETEGKVIDFGAGSGKIAQTIHDAFKIDMEAVDVRDFRSADVTIPFRMFDGKAVPVADGFYEAAVIANVAHHSDDNEAILRELTRITRRKLVVIETIPADPSPEEWAVTFVNDTLWNRFFNYADIPVPGMYESAEGWVSRFAHHGWKVTHSKFLGYDQPMVRVLHQLMVFEKDGCFAGGRR